MKVNSNKLGGANPNLTDGVKGKKTDLAGALSSDKKVGVSSANLKGSSNVDVSERAQMMQKAKGLASDFTVDEAKVSRLQKLIDEGKYKVDADKIANSIVDEHLLTSE